MSERDTIPATCPRCGRPRGMESAERCYEPGSGTCVIAAAAYRRGIASVAISLPSAEVLALLRGLVAERTGGVAVPHAPWCRALDALDELDKAAAAAKGETP